MTAIGCEFIVMNIDELNVELSNQSYVFIWLLLSMTAIVCEFMVMNIDELNIDWHCWFGHLACKNRPRNDLLCVEWEVKPYTLTHSHLLMNHLSVKVSDVTVTNSCSVLSVKWAMLRVPREQIYIVHWEFNQSDCTGRCQCFWEGLCWYAVRHPSVTESCIVQQTTSSSVTMCPTVRLQIYIVHWEFNQSAQLDIKAVCSFVIRQRCQSMSVKLFIAGLVHMY